MPDSHRDVIFISKATPGDDAFTLWLAPKLEAQGYTVFADIVGLSAGDEWRGKLTETLQNRAAKMLLCCSNETLGRRGVKEEIAIAEDLTRELDDANFIIPLRIRPFKKLFGIGGLQYVDFAKGWHEGLLDLIDALVEQDAPRSAAINIQSIWAEGRSRLGVPIERSPETLTSNWLRVLRIPDDLNYVVPRNTLAARTVRKLSRDSEFPLIPFDQGFLTFSNGVEVEGIFPDVGRFDTAETIDFADFIESGFEQLAIESRDARNMMMNLIRQAWEKHCEKAGFLARSYSASTAFHATADQVDIGKRISWGRQGENRSSMLRNISKKKLWEFGVTAIPSLFPYPHVKLKSRVLFSDIEHREKPIIIADKKAQFRFRRSVCSGWRNKAWHGRLMAFMELLTGDSPYVDLAVGSGESITLDGMPVQFTSPVTARQMHRQDEEAEEEDYSTLGGHFAEEDA